MCLVPLLLVYQFRHRTGSSVMLTSPTCGSTRVHRADTVRTPMRAPNSVTCSPSLKGRGFSVQYRSYCHGSLPGLPGPLDVSGRVRIAVQDQPTGGADMGAHGERLLYPFATAATVLAGIGGVPPNHSLTRTCCLVVEGGAALRPAGTPHALVGRARPGPGGDPQIF